MDDLKIKYKNYKTERNVNFFEGLTNYSQPNWNNPNIDMWFQFGIFTNERGKIIADLINKYKPIKNCDYLDVGCAYGGFLTGFNSLGAKRIVGFDINKGLLKLSRENFKDYNINPEIYIKDATKYEELKDLGLFDIITCNDVIEHVDDPEITINNISKLLKPNGIVYFEIPNKNFPLFVIKDGHYSLPLITLLDYNEAKQYYDLIYPNCEYSVGHYLLIEEYERLCKNSGLEFIVMRETFNGYKQENIINNLNKLKLEKNKLLNETPVELHDLLKTKLNMYINEIENTTELQMKYGTSFWKVLCIKI